MLSLKIGENLRDIFSKNRRKLQTNFPKQEGVLSPPPPRSRRPC